MSYVDRGCLKPHCKKMTSSFISQMPHIPCISGSKVAILQCQRQIRVWSDQSWGHTVPQAAALCIGVIARGTILNLRNEHKHVCYLFLVRLTWADLLWLWYFFQDNKRTDKKGCKYGEEGKWICEIIHTQKKQYVFDGVCSRIKHEAETTTKALKKTKHKSRVCHTSFGKT